MGIHGIAGQIPLNSWPPAHAAIVDAGIDIEREEEHPGLLWFGCRRGLVWMGLGLEVSGDQWKFTIYCPVRHFYRHPILINRLRDDIHAAILSAAGAEGGGARDPRPPSQDG